MRNEAGQRLIEFCQENALVIANTLFQQHKRRLYKGFFDLKTGVDEGLCEEYFKVYLANTAYVGYI